MELELIPDANAPATPGRPTIAILGGGYSGSMLTVELLRRAADRLSVVLIERGPVVGRGVAYSTTFAGHLLNVPAKNMSAYADDPGHFLRWAQRHYRPEVTPDDFLPRPVYGDYLASEFHQATVDRGEFRWIRDEAVALVCSGGRCLVRLASGGKAIADKVVLALGNFPPADLQIPGKGVCSSRFVSNPWESSGLAHVERDQSVLLIGSGLTSVDVILELRARGFAGTVHVLSRRGLLPQRHAPVPLPQLAPEQLPRNLRGLVRLIRVQVKQAEDCGSNWRAVIDALRPVTQKIWRSLPPAEQKRFMRHLRPYWDVHRHRIAESIGAQLDCQTTNGRLQMHAGRITEYREAKDGVSITYRDRNTCALSTLRVDRVVNCTGPDGNLCRVGSPLLSAMMESKLVRPDHLSLGLDVGEDGAVIDANGAASVFLYALGPLRKGSLWESIAVPELRVQVAELASELVKTLHTGSATRTGREVIA